MTLIVTNYFVKGKITLLESPRAHGDKKAARSEVVRRTKVTRSHSYAARQYLALIGKLASAVHIMKVEPCVVLESLRKLNMLLFIPQKANLELTLRKGGGHTQEGRSRRIAKTHDAKTVKTGHDKLAYGLDSNCTRTHRRNPVTVKQGKALARLGLV